MDTLFKHASELTHLPRSSLFLATMIGSIAFSSPLLAQDKEQHEIQEIVVEGQVRRGAVTALAIDQARFGTQIQLISSEEIETGGFTNFGELAAGLIRGANIGYSPDEGEFTIRLDGGTDRDTLLLLDGVPTFDRGTPLESLWGRNCNRSAYDRKRGGISRWPESLLWWQWRAWCGQCYLQAP